MLLMPMYDYKCEVCGKKIEIMRKISHRDYTVNCFNPKCEGQMKRVVSAPAVHYDGLKSGDY
ncbi:zinc ribbon domain-containing protein [Klebsiella phage ValerieMcCarty05]|jgi:putative FmdB family regulatory protein|nr:zinc ribbon domain-containing protein [Klebsiella phage ValerieMcCarty05]